MAPNATDEQRKEYLDCAEAAKNGSSVAYPSGTSISRAETSRGQDPFTAFIEHQEKLIVLMATGGTLTSLAQADTGSLAGGAQMDVWEQIVQRDGVVISAALNRDLFIPFLREAFPGEQIVTGLAIFDKRVILYGSEGSSKVFTSKNRRYSEKAHGNLPTAVVEAVDPLVLSMKIVDCSVSDELDFESREIPSEISACFNDQIITSRVGKQLYVTLGQFSIIRLERSTQLLIPMYDYCIPCKECAGGGEEDPCTLFNHIPFPISDFYPPKESPDRCTSGIC